MNKGFTYFLLLWGASMVSATGSGMTAFALGIYVYQETGLASFTALLILLGFLPVLCLSSVAGILADRIDRRLLMMIGDGLSICGLLLIFFSILSLGWDLRLWGIGLGVTVSSALSSLVEPAFRATVSDLLDPEDYTRGSAMIQLVSSARYLLSPILAGLILSFSNMQTILILDMLTIVLTVPVTYLVRRHLTVDSRHTKRRMIEDFQVGFQLLYQNKGIWTLVLFGILISFCLGVVQTLMGPMILAFADSAFLGLATTISSCGMLAAGLFLGKYKLRRPFAKTLSLSLFAIGIAMIGFSSRENYWTTCLFGFGLFVGLTFANTALDVLVRTNLPNQHQGKVWGLIGVISQSGYLLAYATIGLFVDFVSKPLFLEKGLLVSTVGQLIGTGPGRGAAFVIILAGLLLMLASLKLVQNKEVNRLEETYALETD